MVLRQVVNFGVAVFVFLSGYCTTLDKINKKYIIKRVKRLLIPYLIWSVFYIMVQTPGSVLHPDKFLSILLTGAASAQLYYILVLAQLTLLLPLIKLAHKYLIGRCIICLLGLGFYCLLYAANFDLPYKMLIFPAWILFYYVGIYVKDKKINYFIKYKYLPVIVTMLLSIAETFLLNSCYENYNIAVTQLKITNILYSLAMINFFLHKLSSPQVKQHVLCKIGDASYGIYFVHIIALMIVSKILSTIDLNINWIFNMAISFIASAVLSYVIVVFCRKILGEKISAYIGFD